MAVYCLYSVKVKLCGWQKVKSEWRWLEKMFVCVGDNLIFIKFWKDGHGLFLLLDIHGVQLYADRDYCFA